MMMTTEVRLTLDINLWSWPSPSYGYPQEYIDILVLTKKKCPNTKTGLSIMPAAFRGAQSADRKHRSGHCFFFSQQLVKVNCTGHFRRGSEGGNLAKYLYSAAKVSKMSNSSAHDVKSCGMCHQYVIRPQSGRTGSNFSRKSLVDASVRGEEDLGGFGVICFIT